MELVQDLKGRNGNKLLCFLTWRLTDAWEKDNDLLLVGVKTGAVSVA